MASQPIVDVLRWLEVLLAPFHAGALVWFLRRRPPEPAVIVALALLAVAMASHIALSFSWGESEGRFLLTALAPIVYILVAPVFAIAARRGSGERWAWLYLVALALHPYLFLAFA